MKTVIIGNGVAGVSAAETIRAADPGHEIQIFTDEPEPYYSRPRLIEVLAGTVSQGQIAIHPFAWYEQKRIDLRHSTKIVAIDPVAMRVTDDRGAVHGYDRLVVAAGARCNVPPIPGAGFDKVFTLRTAADAATIRAAATGKTRAVVIGGGLLGIEIACSLRTLGLDTTIIEVRDRLLPQQLDVDGSAIVRRLLEAKCLRFVTGGRVIEIVKSGDALEVLLYDGTALPADIVVCSAGIQPRTGLALHTTIASSRGFIVDQFMQTSAPHVYACGDCAEFGNTIYGLWPAAREQGMTAGNHIVGKQVPYQGTVSATRLKVAGVDLASIGDIADPAAEVLAVKIDVAAGSYRKLFAKNGKLSGAILVGNVKDAVTLQQMIKNGEPVGALGGG